MKRGEYVLLQAKNVIRHQTAGMFRSFQNEILFRIGF